MRRDDRISLLLFLLFSGSMIGGAHPAQKAEVRNESGVETVRNGKDPVVLDGKAVHPLLIEDLRIGEAGGPAGPGFSSLSFFIVDDDENIIALDAKDMAVSIFDKTGRFVRKFGKRGQGPDELQQPVGMMLSEGGEIVVLDHGNSRLSFFTAAGVCSRRVPLTKVRPYYPVLDGRGFFYGQAFSFGKAVTLDLVKLNSALSPVATVASIPMPPENKVPPAELMERFYFQTGPAGSLVWATNFKYEFRVTAPDGKLSRIVSRDAEPVKLTRAFLVKELEKRYPNKPVPDSLQIPAHYPKSLPFLRSLCCDDAGRVFIKTYENAGAGMVFTDVFDEKGIYIARFGLAEDEEILALRKGKAFALLKQDERGIPLIKRYRIEWR